MLRCWSDENGFGVNERRTDKSRGAEQLDKIGSDKIGSDAASSAQFRGGDGGEVIRVGLGVGSGCGDICELVL